MRCNSPIGNAPTARLRSLFSQNQSAAVGKISIMYSPLRRISSVLLPCLILVAVTVHAQNSFTAVGNDYPIVGALVGDQTKPSLAVGSASGYLAWQDNAADGNGLGIRAQRLDGLGNKVGQLFRVNSTLAGDQENPKVAMLANGGAVFVWQGGRQGFQKVYARFLPATGTNFTAADAMVNTYTNEFQINPDVAVLKDGSVVVVWASYGQDGYYQGVYGQQLSASGVKVGSEFQVNVQPLNNQRTPSVAALASGGFVVAWVSELQRSQNSVDVFARRYDSSGIPLGGEFPVNTSTVNPCANPSAAASPDGGFAIAWSQNNNASATSFASEFTVSGASTKSLSSWDVLARIYNANGVAAAAPTRLNTFVYGDQYAPCIRSFQKSYLAVWQSLGQDGSMEGIYGQFLNGSSELAGAEFQVNSDNGSRQLNPALASDGANRFHVVWSSFASSASFDLFARAYSLIQLSVEPLGNGQVRLTWNSYPGVTYQVQVSTNGSGWSNQGSPRVAAGLTDSIEVGGANGQAGMYRVVRVQ